MDNSIDFKADKVFQNTTWNGIVVTRYSKKVGNSTYTANSIERLKELCDNHKEPSDLHNKAAQAFYDNLSYKGD